MKFIEEACIKAFYGGFNIALSKVFLKYKTQIFAQLFKVSGKDPLTEEAWHRCLENPYNFMRVALGSFSRGIWAWLGENVDYAISTADRQVLVAGTLCRFKDIDAILNGLPPKTEDDLIDLCRTIIRTTDDYKHEKKMFEGYIDVENAYKGALRGAFGSIFNIIAKRTE